MQSIGEFRFWQKFGILEIGVLNLGPKKIARQGPDMTFYGNK